MEHRLTAEAEAKLNALAQRTNRGTDELLEEAVDHLVAYNEWFEERVREGVAAIERGEVVLMKKYAHGWKGGNARRP